MGIGSLFRHTSLTEMPAVVPEAAPGIAASAQALLPVLERSNRQWQRRLTRSLARADQGADDGVRVGFNAELDLVLVFDTGWAVRPVTAADADTLKLSKAQLVERALANLEERSRKPLLEVARGVFLSRYSDHYDASRLAIGGLFDGLPLDGEPVALVPNRATLIVAGSNDSRALSEAVLHARAAQVRGSSRVTTVPLRRAGSAWESWLPAAHSSARPALEQLVHEQLDAELTASSMVLAELLPHCGQPTIGTRPSADGTRRELVVALPPESQGTEVLLPRAAEVRTPDGAALTWDEFARRHHAALQQVEVTRGEWYRLRQA